MLLGSQLQRPASAPPSQPTQRQQSAIPIFPAAPRVPELPQLPLACQTRSKSFELPDFWKPRGSSGGETHSLDITGSGLYSQQAVVAWAFSAPIDAWGAVKEEGRHAGGSGGGDTFAAHLSAMSHINTGVSMGMVGNESARDTGKTYKVGPCSQSHALCPAMHSQREGYMAKSCLHSLHPSSEKD